MINQLAIHRRARRHTPRLLIASVVLAGPGWLAWAVNGHHGFASAAVTSLLLGANALVTRVRPSLKRRVVRLMQRYVVNPAARLLLSLGVPLGLAILETRGRQSGQPRRTPVVDGLTGDTFWVVAEHGHDANYVRNIKADPHVRVRVRRWLWPEWHDGVATVLPDDDPHARQRQLCRRHPLRALNTVMVRAMGTDLVTVRIDLARNSSQDQQWGPLPRA